MASEQQLQQWWDTLTEEQQAQLKRAIETYPADPSVLDVLSSTNCPIPDGWAVTSWTSVPDSQALSLHGPLAEFIEAQLDHDG